MWLAFLISLYFDSASGQTCTVSGHTLFSNMPGYNTYLFKGNGVFTVARDIPGTVLLAGGGGGGAGGGGGGGGAGALILDQAAVFKAGQTYSITVGAGGLGTGASTQGNSGSDTSIGNLYVARGGGGGGTSLPTAYVGTKSGYYPSPSSTAAMGGSGGGTGACNYVCPKGGSVRFDNIARGGSLDVTFYSDGNLQIFGNVGGSGTTDYVSAVDIAKVNAGGGGGAGSPGTAGYFSRGIASNIGYGPCGHGGEGLSMDIYGNSFSSLFPGAFDNIAQINSLSNADFYSVYNPLDGTVLRRTKGVAAGGAGSGWEFTNSALTGFCFGGITGAGGNGRKTGDTSNLNGDPAIANTGSGGGGGGRILNTAGMGGNGGSGFVIIRIASSYCQACSLGSFIFNGVCTKCNSGSYNVDGITCVDCPAGKFGPSSGLTACETCTADAYCPQGVSAGVSCPAGTYMSRTGASAASDCTSCPAGTYNDASGYFSSCIPCDPGSFMPNTGSAYGCTRCDAGKFAAGSRSSTCLSCSPNFYAPSTGATTCLPCPFNTYTNVSGGSACLLCSNAPAACVSIPLMRRFDPASIASSCDSKYCPATGDWRLESYVCAGSQSLSNSIDGNTATYWNEACGSTTTYYHIHICFSNPVTATSYAQRRWANSPLWQVNTWYLPSTGSNTSGNYQAYSAGSFKTLVFATTAVADYTWEYLAFFGIGPALCWQATWKPVGTGSNTDFRMILTEQTFSTHYCVAGRYVTGTSTCAYCPAGTFNDGLSNTTNTVCFECPAGKYAGSPGVIGGEYCTLCPAGTFSRGTSRILNNTCIPCPANSMSIANRTACMANAGYYNLDDNLLAHYPFRPENVYMDASGNGFTLVDTNVGRPPMYDSSTQPFPGAGTVLFNNSGVNFAGVYYQSTSSQAFTMTVGAGLNLHTMIGTASSPSAGFTLCFWIRMADGPVAGVLNSINAQEMFGFTTQSVSPESRLRFGTITSSNTVIMGNVVNGVNAGGSAHAGKSKRQWSHHCYSFRGITYKAYYDCMSPSCSSNDNTLYESFSSSVLYRLVQIGQGSTDNAYYGWLSDVRYYKKALTPAEVFAVRSYAAATSFSVNGDPALLAYYPFNQANIYADASGNGYTLTSTNGASSAPAFDAGTEPYPGAGAVYFANSGGTGFSGVTIPSATSRSFTVPIGSMLNMLTLVGTSSIPGLGFSFCAWVRGANGAGGTLSNIQAQNIFTFFSSDSISASHYFRVITYISGGNNINPDNYVTPMNVKVYAGGGSFTGKYTNVWSHHCYVFQGRTLRAYFDCSSPTCTSLDATFTYDFPNVLYPNVLVGQGYSDWAFFGWLSQLRYYKKALTPAEVFAIKSFDGTSPTAVNSVNAGLLAYYPFHPNAFLVDASNVTGNLVPTGSPASIPGSMTDLQNVAYFAQAGGLGNANAARQFFTIPQITVGPAFSVCVWYNPDTSLTAGSVGSYLRLIELSATQGSGNVQFRRDQTNNNLGFEILNSASSIISGGASAAIYTGLFQLGVWQHVCLSVSGLTGKVYYNGVQQATTITLTTQKTVTTYTSSYIGQNPYSSDLYRGQLDEVRIYSRAISASEVTSIFNFRGDTYTPGIILNCNPTCAAGTYGHCLSNGSFVCCGRGQFFREGVDQACQQCVGALVYSNGSGSTCSVCTDSRVTLTGSPDIFSFVDGYEVYRFSNSSAAYSISFSKDTYVDILLVGGGGGSGYESAGGGGAGTVIFRPMELFLSNMEYQVVVGSGGASAKSPNGNRYGGNGQASRIGDVWTAAGGGGGGSWPLNQAQDGGSGGGAGASLCYGSNLCNAERTAGRPAAINSLLPSAFARISGGGLGLGFGILGEDVVGTAGGLGIAGPNSSNEFMQLLHGGGGGGSINSGRNATPGNSYCSAFNQSTRDACGWCGAGGDGGGSFNYLGTWFSFSDYFGVPYDQIAWGEAIAGGGAGGGFSPYASAARTCAGGLGGGGQGTKGGVAQSTNGAANTGSGGGGAGPAGTGGNGGAGLVLIRRYNGCCGTGYYYTQDQSCLPCAAGKYGPKAGYTSANECISCDAGTYSTGAGMYSILACRSCDSGKFSNATGVSSSAACLACEAGAYSTSNLHPNGWRSITGMSSCVACPAGTYRTGTGGVSSAGCSLCGAGTYGPLAGRRDNGSSSCLLLGQGFYQTALGLTSINQALPCPPGTYGTGSGYSACTLCDPGKYMGSSGASACTNCMIGTFNPLYGSFTIWDCYQCPANRYSLTSGVSACSQCSLQTLASCTPSQNRTFFRFDTRSGDYQLGPDGTVPYTGASAMPAVLGTVTVSSGTTTVNGQTIPRGMQIWTVGMTGWYDVAAGGASGADYLSSTTNVFGGRGVAIKTRYYLTAGSVVMILVGMKGPGCKSYGFAGGGGGSFVSIFSGSGSFSLQTQHYLILAAGGGGSTGSTAGALQGGADATTGTSGTACRANPGTALASAEGGGGGVALAGGNGVDGTGGNWAGAGAGGGGFKGKGGDGAPPGCTGGLSFLSGGRGGHTTGGTRNANKCISTGLASQDLLPAQPDGGFGGGGGTSNAGAGGGGYSGGQGCSASNRLGGGGGGSYDWNGTGNAGILYSSWDTSVFGPAPTGYAGGYMSSDGTVTISSTVCPAGTYSIEFSCMLCLAGKYTQNPGMTSCLDCVFGSFVQSFGATACWFCDYGKYSVVSGATSCLACPDNDCAPIVSAASNGRCPLGSYNYSETNTCFACLPGSYSSQTGASIPESCVPCLAGSFGNSTGMSACLGCAAGTYSSTVGATESSACTPCSAGSFSGAAGANVSSTCIACSAGSYSASGGASTCTACSAGAYSGTVAASDSNTCTPCSAGSYSAAVGASACIACSAGFYSPTGGARYCIPCVAGAFSDTVGSSTSENCIACNFGKYASNPGASVCIACPANSWSSIGYSTCTANVGYYNLDANANLKAYYTFNPGALLRDDTGITGSLTASASSPTAQASGPFGASSNSAFLTGSASTSPSSNQFFTLPSLTLPNEFSICSWFWISPSISRLHNRLFDFGLGSPNDNILLAVLDVSTDIYAGIFKGTTAEISGYPVWTGGSTASVWKHACLTLSGTSGNFWLDNSPKPFTMTNTRNVANVLTLNYLGRSNWATDRYWFGAIDEFRIYHKALTSTEVNALYNFRGYTYPPMIIVACPTPCAIGSYGGCADNGAAVCTSCPGGSYGLGTGFTSSAGCLSCATGTYFAGSGASTCTSCNAGTYSTTAGASLSSACIACSAGSYSGTVGASASSACIACNAGFYSVTVGAIVSSTCIACNAGFYSIAVVASSSSTCIGCNAGFYSVTVGASALSTCIACNAGFYSATVGASVASTCTACGAGTYSATVGASVASTCTACGAGTYSATVGASVASTCTACGAGTYSATVGASVSSTCTACSAGSYSIAVGAGLSSTCTPCGAGTYSATVGASVASTCTACGAGTYSATVGASVASTCTPCSAGTYSATLGASVSSTCIACNAGFYSVTVGASVSSTCTACSAGTYSATVGASASSTCIACNAGFYSVTVGASVPGTCIACNAGTFSAALGASTPSACTACTAGTYASSTGRSSCASCSVGLGSCAAGTFPRCAANGGFFSCCGVKQFYRENTDSACQNCTVAGTGGDGSGTFCSACTYGIVSVTGATAYSDVRNALVYQFKGGGTASFSRGMNADVLVIGGGGAGGSAIGGGGGAGTLIFANEAWFPAASYPVTVGAGGVKGATNVRGGSGSASSIGGLFSAAGGGGGGAWPSSLATNGGSGGGGGACVDCASTSTTVAATSIVFGTSSISTSSNAFANAGGIGYIHPSGTNVDGNRLHGAGGGGSGTVGGNDIAGNALCSSSNLPACGSCGAGGNGLNSLTIVGKVYNLSSTFGAAYSSVAISGFVAGGGGGGAFADYAFNPNTCAGGSGGGGNGYRGRYRASSDDGLANTGSGGGGGADNSPGGNGGTGLVLVRILVDTCVCGAGTFPTSDGCAFCAAGTYGTGDGQSSCLACETGKFSTGTGMAALAACLDCPAGTFSGATGLPSSASCASCAAGTYSGTTGVSSSAACTACSAGFFATGTGFTGATQCSACAAGTFGLTAGLTLCTSCPAGKYSVGTTASLASNCTSCSAGSYSLTVGASVSSVCTLCLAGTYGLTVGASVASVCTPCVAGTYALTAGASAIGVCTSCPAGTYGVTAGASVASVCTQCPAGKYGLTAGASLLSACTDCLAGTYGVTAGGSTASVCTQCLAGTYGLTTGASVASVCTQCPAGKYGLTAGASLSSVCTNCVAGTYGLTAGGSTASVCTQCLAGTYGLTSGASVASVCTSCLAGTYGLTAGANVASVCTQCLPGTYGLTAGASLSSVCTSCPAGTYSIVTGASLSSACTACSPGSYSATLGASVSSTCLLCPAGTFSAISGAPNSNACTSCGLGTFAAQNASVCTSCPANSNTSITAAPTRGSCLCNPGFVGNLSNLEQACTICPANSYCVGLFQFACPANTYSLPQSSLQSHCRCNAGYKCRYGRNLQLILRFSVPPSTFSAQESAIRAQIASAAGVSVSNVTLVQSALAAGRRMLEVTAYVNSTGRALEPVI